MRSPAVETLLVAVTVALRCVAAEPPWDGLIRNDSVAWAFARDLSARLGAVRETVALSEWAYMTNLTEHNRKASNEMSLKELEFIKNNWDTMQRFNVTESKDAKLKRLFDSMKYLGAAALSEDKQKEYNELQSTMVQIYGNTTVKLAAKDMELEPDLYRVLADMRDPALMAQAWTAWRDAVGRRIRGMYASFLELNNEVARKNGLKDMQEMRLLPYETDNFTEIVESLWRQVEPLYRQLHAYVRHRLKTHFPGVKFPKDGTIPAHLLGNMWAQSWENVFPIVQLPNVSSSLANVTRVMKAKGWNVTRMFREADEFFDGLGMARVPRTFFERSMLERPKNRSVVCHASAWDFFDGRDVRIKMCTEVTFEDFLTVHHEMGHIQYFMQYKDQLNMFREGANPGFHEAIGDLIALSVDTTEHLVKLGLVDHARTSPNESINFLLNMALQKIAFLPFGYLMDRWRWDLFRGEVEVKDMNRQWWKYRLEYQGVSPPVKRSEKDFDPGAKYHIPADVPYIRYFVSFVIQFQFHKALCQVAGQRPPLHRCDIAGNRAAGDRLAKALQKGSSEQWTEVMRDLTGQDKMDAGPLLEYFKPLSDWLEAENRRNGESPGWSEAKVEDYFSAAPPPLRAGVVLLVLAACLLSL